MRIAARLAVVLIVGFSVLLPTPVSASSVDAKWVFRHTKHTGPAPWDEHWTLNRDLTLPALKGAGVRNRSIVSRWVRAQLSEKLKNLGLFYLDNKRGGCDPARLPDRIRSTSAGSLMATRFASVSIKFGTYEGCLGGNMSFTWPSTATWDLRTHKKLTLADIVDLGARWSPEPALAAAINALINGTLGNCFQYPVDADTLLLDTARPSLRDRWTLDKRGLVFHLYGEEAGTAKWCQGPEVLLTWDQLPLTALGESIASDD